MSVGNTFKAGDIVQLVDYRNDWFIQPPPEYGLDPTGLWTVFDLSINAYNVKIVRESDKRGFWLMDFRNLQLVESISIDDDDIWE